MASSNRTLRTVQESEQFRAEKERITFGERDADELLQMDVYWPLARNPEWGAKSHLSGVFMYFFEPLAGHEYIVYYEFDEHSVVLLSIVPGGRDFKTRYE